MLERDHVARRILEPRRRRLGFESQKTNGTRRPMITIAIVSEGPSDARTAKTLVDEILCLDIDWVEHEVIDGYRKYYGHQTDDALYWRHIPELAKQHGVVVAGFMKGEPPNHDAHATLRALRLLDKCNPRPQVVLLLRDSDNNLDKKIGIDKAREHFSPEIWPIILGLAHTKSECWVIAGFEPNDKLEAKRVEQLRVGELPGVGFDARHRSEDLTAKEGHKLCAKRVLHYLTESSHDREHRCLVTIVKDKLHESRGQNNGLGDFISEIRSRLLPKFTWRNHT